MQLYGITDINVTDPTADVTAANKAATTTDAIIAAIGKVVPLWQQQKIFSAQLAIEKQRAKASGGALDLQNLQPPAIPVSFGMNTNTLLLAGVGLLAVVLLMKKRR